MANGRGLANWLKFKDKLKRGWENTKENVAEWKEEGGPAELTGNIVKSAPAIYGALNNGAQDASSASEADALGKGSIVNLASQGMQLGSVAGPWGMLAGGIGGAAIGTVKAVNDNVGFAEKQNEKVEGEFTKKANDLAKEWYAKSDSDRIQNTLNLIKQQRGMGPTR